MGHDTTPRTDDVSVSPTFRFGLGIKSVTLSPRPVSEQVKTGMTSLRPGDRSPMSRRTKGVLERTPIQGQQGFSRYSDLVFRYTGPVPLEEKCRFFTPGRRNRFRLNTLNSCFSDLCVSFPHTCTKDPEDIV